MDPRDPIVRAAALFHEAFGAQMRGELEHAVTLYRRSLSEHPTAEAHTFLGWTYSFQGDLERAIAECKKAIAVDPAFGNPYNDIGAYLIQMGCPAEAIPWLEEAVLAPRYDARHYPHFNLGRAYVAKQMYTRALECFERALAIRPDYTAARHVVESVRRKLN